MNAQQPVQNLNQQTPSGNTSVPTTSTFAPVRPASAPPCQVDGNRQPLVIPDDTQPLNNTELETARLLGKALAGTTTSGSDHE